MWRRRHGGVVLRPCFGLPFVVIGVIELRNYDLRAGEVLNLLETPVLRVVEIGVVGSCCAAGVRQRLKPVRWVEICIGKRAEPVRVALETPETVERPGL